MSSRSEVKGFGARGLAAAATLVLVASIAPGARAQEATVAPESWAGQLETLTRWLEQRRHEATCRERCYVLDRLRLTGDVEAGTFDFELQGSVLADDAVAVPLFGPPSQVRVEQAMLDNAPARIGFEGDSYYLFTDARAFALRGRITLQGDRALSIAGPLNTLEAELSNGRVVEGPRLSGIHGATIHFERGAGAAEQEEPTVFQLSRAVRVGREITFEYALEMRSGNDLGVVRLPLRFGEQVLEVAGSTGWRVEGEVLLLPTSGRTAQMTITGRLASIGTVTPDERSSYEWWLFESDAEHRVTMEGGGRQFDVAESPIARTQPNARLFMIQRGQDLRVEVQRLVGSEVLGAVIRSHSRTVVLTRQGGLVAQDEIAYENNGIDYLALRPQGKAIFLATDGQAERIMQKSRDDEQILLPLRTGTHTAKVQSQSLHRIGPLWGRLEVPTPAHQLTASRVTLLLGLPRFVHPLVFVGGDEIEWFVGLGDLAALLLGVLAAVVVLRGLRRRAFGAVVLGGLWFLSPGLFVVALVALALGGGLWALTRLLSGPKLAIAVISLFVVGGIAGIIALAATFSVRGRSELPVSSSADWSRQMDEDVYRGAVRESTDDREQAGAVTGNRMAQLAQGGLIEGVTPVALPLPQYHQTAVSSRELVTERRPFSPALYYVTDWVIWPLVLLWLACLGLLGASYRRELAALYARWRERLARPAPPASPAAPAETPPATT